MRFSVLKVDEQARSGARCGDRALAAWPPAAAPRSPASSGVDDIFTASTTPNRAITPHQAEPALSRAIRAPPRRSPARSTAATGSVSARGAEAGDGPPRHGAAPAAAAAEPRGRRRPASRSAASRAAAAALDDDHHGSGPGRARPSHAAAEADPEGWSRAGGTQVTVKDGETVYNLSRRFGVPADVIMKTNGISDGNGLRAGQKIVIPTYVYSRQAPVSAPDSDPNVADARSSRGTKYDVPAEKVPVPTKAPTDVAVLPQQPKLKDGGPRPDRRRRAAARPTKAKPTAAPAPTRWPRRHAVAPSPRRPASASRR